MNTDANEEVKKGGREHKVDDVWIDRENLILMRYENRKRE